MKIKNLLLSSITLTALAFAVSSCSDKKNEAPVITIYEPTDGSSWQVDSTIHIETTVTDDEGLHEMGVYVFNSGGTVFQEIVSVHDLKTKDYHEHITIPVAGTYTVKVAAEDHEGASAEKTVSITVTP